MLNSKTMLLMLFVAIPAHAQTDLIFPWVTNNSAFRGKLIVNNLGSASVTFSMTAQREVDAADAVLTETVEASLDALGQLVVEAGTLFQEMGEGSAYMVRLTSTSSDLAAAFVNVGTQSQSGSSPAQANVFKASDVADTWLFSYAFNGDGFTAPAIINLGNSVADVTLYAFQNGQRVSEISFQVQAGKPWADVTANLFPELSGDFYMVAHAEGGSLLGTSFVFNTLLEPAMANAVPLSRVPSEGQSGSIISFANQIQPIITTSCGGNGSCHLNGGNEKGLVLDAGVARGNMVNKKSTVISSETLIIPGDADQSYLFRKLQAVGNGVFYAGKRMPDGGPFLSGEQIETIRNWILQGAIDN